VPVEAIAGSDPYWRPTFAEATVGKPR
jgi:hypothetical protein